MKQLRYLKTASLYFAEKIKQPNGAVITRDTLQGEYHVQVQELTDEVSASLYGAEMNKMLRISSYLYPLETYLAEKTLPTTDNLSEYFIVIEDRKYRITTVRMHWVDIEFVETYGANSI